MKFVDEFGPAAFINRARKEGARDFGACMSPHTAFLILQGLETLSLRMERHVSNTREVVNFLSEHDAVKSVSYPELDNHPDHKLAQKSFQKVVVLFSLLKSKEVLSLAKNSSNLLIYFLI